MTFTYNLASTDEDLLNISKVRLELGDTTASAGVRPDGSNLTDEEILLWLEEESDDVLAAVGRAASALANMWTNVANITVGPRREELGSIAKGWADRALSATPSSGYVYTGRIISLDLKHNPYRVRPEEESSR
jgi:hypothetical protein